MIFFFFSPISNRLPFLAGCMANAAVQALAPHVSAVKMLCPPQMWPSLILTECSCRNHTPQPWDKPLWNAPQLFTLKAELCFPDFAIFAIPQCLLGAQLLPPINLWLQSLLLPAAFSIKSLFVFLSVPTMHGRRCFLRNIHCPMPIL